MPNIDAEHLAIVKFAQQSETVATPAQIYRDILFPQTNLSKPRLYFAGPITSGGIGSKPGYESNVSTVIQENTLFAVTFWKCLLNSKLPLALPNPPIPDIRQTLMLSPHTLGRCVLPEADPRTGETRWGEYDFYTLWYSWMLGLHPEAVPHFEEKMLAGVALHILRNHDLPRTSRRKETLRIIENISNYHAVNANALKPIKAMISIPNPDPKKTLSLGTEAEQDVMKNIGIPSYDTVVHPETAKNDAAFEAAWSTLGGEWLLNQLTNSVFRKDPSNVSVTFQLRDSVEAQHNS